MCSPYSADVGARHCLARLAVRSESFHGRCKEFQEFSFSVYPVRMLLVNQGIGKLSERFSQLRGHGHHGGFGQGVVRAVVIIGKYRGYGDSQYIFHLIFRKQRLLGDAV